MMLKIFITIILMLLNCHNLYSELSAEILSDIQNYIKENDGYIQGGIEDYINKKYPPLDDRYEIYKWAVENDSLNLKEKLKYYGIVIEIPAQLGNIEIAETWFKDFKEKYKGADFTINGYFGVRNVQTYLPSTEFRLQREIEKYRQYYRAGEVKDYSKVIELLQKERDFLLSHIQELSGGELKNSFMIQTEFTHFQQSGEIFELDNNMQKAMEQYKQAVNNYEKKLINLDLIIPVKENLKKRYNILQNKIFLENNKIKDESEEYRIQEEIIEYHSELGIFDGEIANQHLQRLIEIYKNKDFPVDGIIGVQSVSKYVPLDVLKFKAMIEEGQLYFERDFSKVINSWEKYRESLLPYVKDIKEEKQHNEAIIYTEFSYYDHLGRLYDEEYKIYPDAQKYFEKAMTGYENKIVNLHLDEKQKNDLQEKYDDIKSRYERSKSSVNP